MKLALSALAMAVASAHRYYDGSHESFLKEQEIEMAQPIDFTDIASAKASLEEMAMPMNTILDLGEQTHHL